MTTKKNTPQSEPVTTLAVQTAATRELTPGIWKMISEMAPVLYQARMFKVNSPAQAAAVMLKGYECGLSMSASFDFVKVIMGNPEIIPRGALALIHNSPLIKKPEINRLTDKSGAFIGYSCTMERSNGFAHTSQFTLEDAKKAGLLKADSAWMHYPENMCLWRAIGFCADVVAPDVTAGMTSVMKAPEMYGVALTEGGDVVDVIPTSVSVDPLQELLTQYGAEAIMSANDGQIPSNGQVEEVRRKLENGQNNGT